MEDKATGNQTHRETCICREIEAHLTAIFGVGSEEAWNHVRNARVEMLKAVRSIIDARIEHLSGTEHKGTKVTVE
jgi:ribosomal protein S13